MGAISIHDFLWDSAKHPAKTVCVVFGDDPFLKFHAVRILRQQVLSDEDAEFSLTRFDGETVRPEEVFKELATLPMFGGDRRLVLIENADSFITKNREALEDYVEKPSARSVLILQAQTFPATTRLFKRVSESGLVIEAKSLPEKDLPKWIIRWSKHQYNTVCGADAAGMLADLVGTEHGLLDQELAKLSLMVPPKGPITAELVEKAVGSWRSQSTFEMLDLALAGQTAAAIRQLDKLLLAGENAIGILAQIASTLRKFGAATQLILDAEKERRKLPVSAALEQVGIKRFFAAKAETQLKALGRRRGARLLDWLLRADLDLKGGSRSDPRLILEMLIIQISDPRLKNDRLENKTSR